MPSLDLTTVQAATLAEYLHRVLSDLSVEIADTDRKEYRDEIKAERQMLQQILAQLTTPPDSH